MDRPRRPFAGQGQEEGREARPRRRLKRGWPPLPKRDRRGPAASLRPARTAGPRLSGKRSPTSRRPWFSTFTAAAGRSAGQERHRRLSAQAVARCRHLGGRHQLSLRKAGGRGGSLAAGEGPARRRRPRASDDPLQGEGVEPRQGQGRRHRRLGAGPPASSLWLAFHDDMGRSQESHADPIAARESTSPLPVRPSTAPRSRSTRKSCASGSPTTPTARMRSA